MKATPTHVTARQADTATTASESSSGSSRADLRGLSYDEQVAKLAPVQQLPVQKKTRGGGGDDADGETDEPKVSKREARGRLEEILDPSNAPLEETVVAEARGLVTRFGKKKQQEWTEKLDARVATGEAETELITLLDGLAGPITADQQKQAEGLVGRVAENRRPDLETKLAYCVEWGEAESEVAAVVENKSSAIADGDVAKLEGLIAKLPQERRGDWTTKLKMRVDNDPIEAQLKAKLAVGGRLDEAQIGEISALIGQLSNGEGGAWQKQLDARKAADMEQVFEGDEATRGAALSTLTADQVTERTGNKKTRRGDNKGDQRTRVEFDKEDEISAYSLRQLGKKDEAGYAAGVEKLAEEKSKGMNLAQKALLAKAKEFLSNNPSPSPERAAFAELSIPGYMQTSPDLSLDGELIARMKRFTRFAAWAGLIGAAPTVNDGVRSPANAHKLSTAYQFTKSAGLGGSDARKRLAEWAIANDGKAPDRQWIPLDLVKRLKEANGDDDVYVQVLVKEMKERTPVKQKNQAAEGYKRGAAERMPNIRDTGVSLHCSGQAIDVTYAWVFSNSYDPMIDLLAAYFGLWRPVKDSQSSPEDWHYEKLGSVVASDATAE